jgi:O-methyltransferase
VTLRANYQKYTKASEARLQAMRDCLLAIEREGLAGDVVECGVWRGGNIILARKIAPARMCWLFDTFAGMTAPTELDAKPNGFRALDSFRVKTASRPWAAASIEEVRSCFAETGTLDDGLLRFVVGPVERTLLEPANLPERIALLRLDTDWHASTKIELEVLFPRLVPGGFLIVDDYGHWLGARKAVDDYFAPRTDWHFVQAIDDTGIIIAKPKEREERT